MPENINKFVSHLSQKERGLRDILPSPVNSLGERNPCEAIPFPVSEVTLKVRQAESAQKRHPLETHT